MPVGFVDPASLFGVVGEGGGVDALRGQHRDRGGVGDEGWGSVRRCWRRGRRLGLGARRQWPPARRDLIDRGVAPVVVVASAAAAAGGGRGDGDRWCGRWVWASAPMRVLARVSARSYSARTVVSKRCA